MSRRSTRRGVTLIDLVVMLAIVGIMAAIFLPVLQKHRQAAQLQNCSNKMKQLGVALHNHHDVYKKFPPTSHQGNREGIASVWWPAPGSAAAAGEIPSLGYTKAAGTQSATAGYSWIVRLMPYMDEAPIYNLITQASGKFQADAFTPYDVAGVLPDDPARTNFSVTTTSEEKKRRPLRRD